MLLDLSLKTLSVSGTLISYSSKGAGVWLANCKVSSNPKAFVIINHVFHTTPSYVRICLQVSARGKHRLFQKSSKAEATPGVV